MFAAVGSHPELHVGGRCGSGGRGGSYDRTVGSHIAGDGHRLRLCAWIQIPASKSPVLLPRNLSYLPRNLYVLLTSEPVLLNWEPVLPGNMYYLPGKLY